VSVESSLSKANKGKRTPKPKVWEGLWVRPPNWKSAQRSEPTIHDKSVSKGKLAFKKRTRENAPQAEGLGGALGKTTQLEVGATT